MKITGNFKPKTGTEEEYTVDFEQELTHDTIINCKIWDEVVGEAGFFSATIDKKLPSSFYQVSYRKGTKSFKFKIFWAEECKKAYITINGIKGTIFNYETQLFAVTIPTLTLQTIPPEIKLGMNISCETLLGKDYSNEKQYQVEQIWELPDQLFKRIGNPGVNRNHLYQTLHAIELGQGVINLSVKVQYLNKSSIKATVGRGRLNVEVKNPYTLAANKSSTCIGGYVTYTIKGLQGGEKIVWKAVQHAKLYNGQGTSTAVFQATEQGYLNVNVTIQFEQASISLNSNEVWSGKPTINTGLKTSHVMKERTPVIIDASNEFFHYNGGISYAIESEDAEYFTVTETNKKFKVETTIPGNKRGQFKLRLKVSNGCGEVSNLHTIVYDTLPGLEPAKAIDLFSAKEHEFSCVRTYDMVKYVGNLQTFQMFFTFTLERKATIKYIRPFFTEDKYLGFRIFYKKDEDLQAPLYTHEASDTYMTIDNMPPGEYMMVLDIERNHSDKLEMQFSGFIGGSSPIFPYVIEPNENGFKFSDCRNTETYNNSFYYKNEQGESVGSEAGTHNTYYILTLEKPMQLILHTADSQVSTEFHIMQGEPYDWKVLYHETGGNYHMEEIQADPEVPEELKSMLLNSLLAGQTYVKRFFPAGEYRFVLNGIKKSNLGLYNGNLNFNVIGLPITGNSFDTALDLGKFIEHKFQTQTLLRNIQARKEMEVKKIYYHLAKEKNMDLKLAPHNGTTYLPIELYNGSKEKIASFDIGTEAFRLDDVLSNELYIVVNIENALDDVLKLSVAGVRRGTDPFIPYNWGIFEDEFTVADKVDTADGVFYESFRYKDEKGEYPVIRPEANHVYYKLSIKKRMQLIIHTAQSDLGVMELYIMQGEPYDWKVLLYDDGGDFTPEEIANDPQLSDDLKKELATLRSEQIYIKRIFEPGEYRFVLNGRKISNASRYNGGMNLHIVGQLIEETSFDTAYDLGTFKEHEFNFNQIFSDIQAHKESGIQKLYYQFHMEKNVDFRLNAKSKSSFLPIVLYNSNKESMSTSETEEGIRINDMIGGKFYFAIDIASVTEDELTIEGKGMFRGRDPYFSYNLGTHDKDFTISDTINTADGGFYETFKYTDESGNLIYTNEPGAHHVYYKIILQKEMQLIIHTTYSELPLTELHIMKGEPFGWNVLYYKDYGCGGIENDPDIPEEIKQNIKFGQICVKINLPAGEYKLVLNGTKRTNAGFRNGVLVTNVIGKVI